MRYEAAVALGNLRVSTIRGWNYELQGLIVAKVLRDVVLERQDGKIQNDWCKYFVLQLANAITAIKDSQGKELNATFRQMLVVCGPIIQEVLSDGMIELRRWTTGSLSTIRRQ